MCTSNIRIYLQLKKKIVHFQRNWIDLHSLCSSSGKCSWHLENKKYADSIKPLTTFPHYLGNDVLCSYLGEQNADTKPECNYRGFDCSGLSEEGLCSQTPEPEGAALCTRAVDSPPLPLHQPASICSLLEVGFQKAGMLFHVTLNKVLFVTRFITWEPLLAKCAGFLQSCKE